MFRTVFDTLPLHATLATTSAPPMSGCILAMGGLELGAGALLMLALLALAAALRNLARQPGGLRSLFDSDPAESDSAPQHAAEELRLLIAEARELSDRLADRFDGRAAEMASLLKEADLRIARLEQALRAEHSHSPVHTDNPAANEHAFAAAGPRGAPRAASIMESVAAGHGGDPMASEIYRLSDEGLPPVEIATRLGQHTGKVELILALRRG